MIKLINAEAVDFLERHGRGTVRIRNYYDIAFADPPDNIGLEYSGLPPHWDSKSMGDYYNWMQLLILGMTFESPIVWLSYYHGHDVKIKSMVNHIIKQYKPSWSARTFIWRFRFGQYRETDCANGYRSILRLNRFGIIWNTDAIRVESERMRLGDARAAGPRVPDDVWDFPRIQGNNVERRRWCPTQHPEALLERIIKLSSKERKLRILELFTGSGTMIRVVNRLNSKGWEIDLDTVDLNGNYVQQLVKEHPNIKVEKW